MICEGNAREFVTAFDPLGWFHSLLKGNILEVVLAAHLSNKARDRALSALLIAGDVANYDALEMCSLKQCQRGNPSRTKVVNAG